MTIHPVRDYLIALAIVLCSAVSYRIVAVPLIEPEVGNLAEVHAGMQELVGPDLAHVFPADSWQMNNPKYLRADWGWVLFQESQHDSPDRWKVSPVSVVMIQKNAGNDGSSTDPIVLDAPEGAVIEFSEPLNMISGARPKIKGGQLLGEVHIYNHFQETNHPSHYQVGRQLQENQFDLMTRTVRIDSRQIRSAEAVKLNFGGSRLAGRDLTIKLASGGSIPTSSNGPLSMLDSLELIYLDELVIPLPEGPLWKPNIDSNIADASLSVICDGRVVFDFPTLTLRLNERVQLLHHWSDTDYDSFSCRSLEIQLANEFDKEIGASVPSTPDAPADSNVVDSDAVKNVSKSAEARINRLLRKITARGEPIQADVPSVDCRMTATEIKFEATEGRLHMTGESDTIDLVYAGTHLSIPELEYEFDIQNPTTLGKLTIPGAGTIHISDESIPIRTFKWAQSLQITPEQIGHLLWIVGDVQGQMRDGGSVSANDLLAAFQLIPTRKDEPQANPEIDGSNNSQAELNFQLDKLRVRGNVHVDTAQLAADTDVLLVLLEHLEKNSGSTEQGDASSSSLLFGPRLNSADGPKKRFWINDPASQHQVESALGNSQVAPVAAPRPTLSGEAITANLIVNNNEVIAQDVSVYKNVQLKHELQTKDTRLPLTYSGDSLRLITGSGDDRVQIAGKPARIDLGNGFFEGPLVVISGLENRVSIRDYGTFQIPLAIMPKNGTQQTRWISPPTCRFQGELTFDGKLVEIDDEVQLTGQVAIGDQQDVWSIDASAPKLELTLDRPVQVTQPTNAKEASVERVSLVGTNRDVLLRATKFSPQGQPLGHHVLNNPRLDFYAATGQLLGPGPGWYRSWTPTQEDSPLRSIAPPGSLMAVHLLYNGGLDGNLADQQLGFHRGVRIGMSSVPGWDSNIDAATMSQLKLNQGTVDCDRLQLGVASTRSKMSEDKLPWEIQALGGVAFRMMTERGLVDGTAARAAYDAANDLFVLEGSPAADAVVRNTSPTGQPLMNVSMISFTLRPETLEINSLLRGATVSQLPGQRP